MINLKNNYYLPIFTNKIDSGKYCEFNFFLKNGEKLSKDENDLILRINKTIFCINNDSDFIDKVFDFMEPKFGYMYREIEVLPNLKNETDWGNNIFLYDLSSIDYNVNISFEEIKRIILEQNINVVFTFKNFLNYNDLCISKTTLSSYLSLQYDKYVDLIYGIIKDDIKVYNNFLSKVDYNIPACQKYLCLFHNLPLVSEKSYIADVGADYILEILLILNIDKIIDGLDKYDNIKWEEYNNKIKELEDKAENCIKEIKESMIKAIQAKNLNRGDAEMFYKSFIKKYLEKISNDALKEKILNLLSLSINRNGIISFKGYDGKQIFESIFKPN